MRSVSCLSVCVRRAPYAHPTTVVLSRLVLQYCRQPLANNRREPLAHCRMTLENSCRLLPMHGAQIIVKRTRVIGIFAHATESCHPSELIQAQPVPERAPQDAPHKYGIPCQQNSAQNACATTDQQWIEPRGDVLGGNPGVARMQMAYESSSHCAVTTSMMAWPSAMAVSLPLQQRRFCAMLCTIPCDQR